MKRRTFLQSSSAFTIGGGLMTNTISFATEKPIEPAFKMNFAPHLGMFKHLAGDDPVDQLHFMADQGFRSFEDNGMKIVTDLRSFLYLCNTTLEFSGGLNGKGFQFVNPNAARTCGCGESFAV